MATMDALMVETVGKPVVAGKRPVPTPKEGEIRLRTTVVGLNPYEHRVRDWGLYTEGQLPVVIGNDIAGIIDTIGPNTTTDLKPGDHVFGQTNYLKRSSDQSGLQEFCILDAYTAAKIPKGFMDDDGASMVCNLVAPFWAIFGSGGLDLPFHFPDNPQGSKDSFDFSKNSIVIIGAGSNCGKYGVQSCALAGFGTIIATATKSKNEAELRSYGATHVIDRHSPDAEQQIRAIVGDDLVYAFDAVNLDHTFGVSVLSNTKRGTLATIVPGKVEHPDKIGEKKAGYDDKFVQGQSHNQPALGAKLWSWLPVWMKAGKMKATKWQVLEGLDAGKINEVLDSYRDFRQPETRFHVHLSKPEAASKPASDGNLRNAPIEKVFAAYLACFNTHDTKSFGRYYDEKFYAHWSAVPPTKSRDETTKLFETGLAFFVETIHPTWLSFGNKTVAMEAQMHSEAKIDVNFPFPFTGKTYAKGEKFVYPIICHYEYNDDMLLTTFRGFSEVINPDPGHGICKQIVPGFEPTEDYATRHRKILEEIANPASLAGFAATISENAKIVDEFIASMPIIPRPTFTPEGPIGFPCPPQVTHIHAARENLLDAAKKLYYLTLGPVETLFELATRCHDSASLHTIYRFNMAAKVPVNGEASFAEIAQACGVDEDRTRRVIKLAITNGLFKETRPGYVSHTGVSALMAQNTMGVNAVVGHVIDDIYPASCKLADTMAKFPVPKNRLVETPFAMAFNTAEPFFDWMEKHPERINRFHESMRAVNNTGPYSGEALAQGYDWSALTGATLVDVGGSSGHTTLKIAENSEIGKFIVQDFNKEEVKNAQKSLPEKYHGRVEFMEHDFFKAQPVKGADAYFLRFILHDWPDQECIEILKNLVPALKDGAKVLISDLVLPEPNTVPNRIEKEMRICDLHVLSLIGSREREIGAWKSLFESADARFKFVGAIQPPGSALSVIEARFEELKN